MQARRYGSTPEQVMNQHYRTLGLGQGASLDQVKSRYRALAMEFHPDHNPQGLGRMQAVNVAYKAIITGYTPCREATPNRAATTEPRREATPNRDVPRNRSWVDLAVEMFYKTQDAGKRAYFIALAVKLVKGEPNSNWTIPELQELGRRYGVV